MKNLRSEISRKEEHLRDLDERVSLENDRLFSLGNELKMAGQATIAGGISNSQQSHLREKRTKEGLSMSPHR